MSQKVIWDFLRSKGVTEAGAAGLMGNLQAESGLKPQNLQDTGNKKLGMTDEAYTIAVDSGQYANFAKDGLGYGLAQWTWHTRKAGLLDFAKSRNASVGDLMTQLEFLWLELGTSFPNVKAVLCSTNSVEEASLVVLLEYEKPYDSSASVQNKRTRLSLDFYNTYATKGVTALSNSKLATRTILSPHKSARTGEISKIAIHCMAGAMTAEQCGNYFAKTTTKASSHYGIGSEGDCCQYVNESDRAWCTGGTKTYDGRTGAQTDHIAVTIEVANTERQEPWAISDKAYQKLLDLVEDIARRNGLAKVTYAPDGSGTLQAHRWYAAKSCPGNYLMSKFPEIAQIVTQRIQGSTATAQKNDQPFKLGETLQFKGTTHFSSAAATTGKPCLGGTVRITSLSHGAPHPYHVVGDKKPCNAYGWVDAETLKR